MIDSNATQAAIRAGYSEKTAYSIGDENLKKPEIQKFISEKQAALSKKADITVERVLAEYAKIGFFDIRKAFDDEGKMKPIHELDDDTAGGIAGIEVYEEIESVGEETFKAGQTKKIKISDKRSALDSICKVLGFNAPDKSVVDMGITWNEEKTYAKPTNE